MTGEEIDPITQSDAQWLALADQLPVVVWSVDRELRLTSTRGGGLSGVGLSKGQGLGRSLYEYFGTQDASFGPIAAHLRALAGQAVSYETLWEGRWFETRTAPHRDQTGAIVGALGMSIDVTERRQAEEARADLQLKLRDQHRLEVIGQLGAGLALSPEPAVESSASRTTQTTGPASASICRSQRPLDTTTRDARVRACAAPRLVGVRRRRGTIAAHGGGLILAEKQTRADAEEPAEKLPELFDLHVMMFADRSDAIAAALQEAFAIDRVMAASLLADTPIVVKRAADPTVAAALLDVLQRLGAQVVLLPSTGERAPQSAAAQTRGSSANLWGGLDLAPAATHAPSTDADAYEQGLAAQDHEPEVDSELEEDLTQPSEPVLGLESNALPGALERPPSEPSRASPPAPPPPLLLDLGLGDVPPLPNPESLGAISLPPPPVPVSLPPSVPLQALRGPAVAQVSHVAAPVPASRGPATPSPVRNAAAVKPAAKPAPQPRQRPDPRAAVVPELRLPELMPARAPSTAKRAERPLEPTEAQGPQDRPSTDAAARPAPSARPATGRSRFMSLAELVAGVLVLYLGVRMDNSVLYGNANYLSLAMHGLAFYGIGAGIAGLWP